MIDILRFSFLGLMVLVFQWMLGDLFSILGTTPNFLVIFIIYLGLTHSQLKAIWLGFILGFLSDALVATHLLGLSALALAIVGYLAGVFHGRIVRIPIPLQYLLHSGFLLVFFTLTVLVSFQDASWGTGNIVFLILLPKTLYTLGVLSTVFILLRVGAD